MALNSKKILVFFKEYLLITLGILLFVLGWTVFLVPNNLVGGGVTGIASIIQYATGGAVKIGYSYFAINAILLVAALFILGPDDGRRAMQHAPGIAAAWVLQPPGGGAPVVVQQPAPSNPPPP